MMKFALVCLGLITVFFGAQRVEAGEVKIVDAVAKREINSFSSDIQLNVTLEHADEGWKHYADRWDVWTADGKTLLGTRKLLHPHVDEQPFTRSLTLSIPEGVEQVLIRAHDTLHGDSPHTFMVTLP